MITIKQNDYIHKPKIREYVVQGICDVFLGNDCGNIFHPNSGSWGHSGYRYICRNMMDEKFSSFDSAIRFPERYEYVRFTSDEMKQAFKEIIHAGYYIFRVTICDNWMGYKVYKTPFGVGEGMLVDGFYDRID